MSAGRPKLDALSLVKLSVTVRQEERDALEAYANANDYPVAGVVRLALRAFLRLQEIPEKKIK